ncbi:MAG: hypothetical protein ACE5FS_03290 [Paracoccaceae bacterium]
MARHEKPLSERELDTLFAAVREDAGALPEHLVAAVLADASRVAAERKPAAPAARRQRRPAHRFSALLDGLGGWPGAATVVASGLLGLWIGVSDLASLPYLDDIGSELNVFVDGSDTLLPLATLDDLAMDG